MNCFKQYNKILFKVVFFIVIILIVLKILISCNISLINNSNVDINNSKTENKLSIVNYNDAVLVALGLAMKNSDWSNYPLSKKFLEKYNSSTGVFPSCNYSEVNLYVSELEINNGDNYSFDTQYYLYSYLNNDYRDIHGPSWNVNTRYLLDRYMNIDDVIIYNFKQLTDDDGFLIKEYDSTITVDNCFLVLHDILFYDHNSLNSAYADDRPPVERLPISNKLLNKIIRDRFKRPYFNDFFENKEFQIGGIKKNISQSKKEAFDSRCCYAVCQTYDDNVDLSLVLSGDDKISRPIYVNLFKIIFELDNNLCLDDFIIEFIGKYTEDEVNKICNDVDE